MSYVNGASVIAIGVLFPVLGSAAVAARFYVRHSRKMPFGIDDWLCLPALIFLTGCSTSLIVGAAGHAIGYHSKPKENAGNNEKIVFLEKCEYAFNIMQPLALGFIKLSILFLYRRIFRGRVFDIMSWTLIALVVLWTLGFFLVQVFDCGTHFYTNWGPLSDLEKCLSTFKQLLAYSVSDVIMDVFILILPVPLIWMLHMTIERKLAVTGIFLLGTIAVLAGILRLVVFAQILGAGHTQVVLKILGVIILDDMAVVSLILFWPMIQMGIAMVTACLPTLRPIFHGVSPESVIRSIRSKLSLQSIRGRSSPSQGKCNVERTSHDSIIAFTKKSVSPNEGLKSDEYLETYVMGNIGIEQGYDQLAADRINVRDDVTQSTERV